MPAAVLALLLVLTPMPPEAEFTPREKLRQWEQSWPSVRYAEVCSPAYSETWGPPPRWGVYLREYDPYTGRVGREWKGHGRTEAEAVDAALRRFAGGP